MILVPKTLHSAIFFVIYETSLIQSFQKEDIGIKFGEYLCFKIDITGPGMARTL